MAGTFTTHVPDLAPVSPAEPRTVVTSIASNATVTWNTVLSLSGESGWVYMLTGNAGAGIQRVTVDGGTARELDLAKFHVTRNISSISPSIVADIGKRAPLRIRFESSLLVEIENDTSDTVEGAVVYALDI